jgi:hypothetical protein
MVAECEAVIKFADELGAAMDGMTTVEEFVAFHVPEPPDNSYFTKKEFSNHLATCQAALQQTSFALQPHDNLYVEATTRHYIDTARHLYFTSSTSNSDAATKYPRCLWTDGLGRTLLLKLLSAPKLSPSSLGKTNVFNSSDTSHWISAVENYVGAQGIYREEGKMKVAISFLDAERIWSFPLDLSV